MSAKNKAAVFGVVGFCFLFSFVAPVYGESESECVAYKRNYDEAIAQKKTPPAPAICDEATAVGPVMGHCVVGTSICKGEKTAEGKDPSKPDVQVDTSKNSPTNNPDALTPFFRPDGQEPKPVPPPPGSGKSFWDQMLDPTPIAEQKTPLPDSAKTVEDIFRQTETNTGFVDQISKKIGNFFSPEPINPTQESFQLQPRDAEGNLIPQNPGTTFDPSRNTPGSTFAQPEASTEQKDESLCGWTCTIQDYAGRAWNAVAKEFGGGAEAKASMVTLRSTFYDPVKGQGGPLDIYGNRIDPRGGTMASNVLPQLSIQQACLSSCTYVLVTDTGAQADLIRADAQRIGLSESMGVARVTYTQVAQADSYTEGMARVAALNTPLPTANPLRLAENAINNSASSFYNDYPLPSGESVTQQFLAASNQQIQSSAIAYDAGETFTAAQANPDFSTSGDTSVGGGTGSGTGNVSSVSSVTDTSEPIDLTPETVAYDSLLSRPATTRSLVNFDAYSPASNDPFATSEELDFLEAARNIRNASNDPSVTAALDQQNDDLENHLASQENIRNAANDSITGALDQQEYAASLYEQAQRFASDPFLTDAEFTDLQAQQLQRDIEKAYNDRLVLADEQDAAFNTQAEREAYLSAQEEIISGLVPKPEAVEVTPAQIKEQVRLAQNAEKEEFTVAKPADLARIMATPAISGHLSLDMIQKLKSFTNDDEFGTFTNEELEKGIEWADLPKNAYPAMAQIAKDAGFEAPPFQESNNREPGIEDTVSMSRKLEVLADRRLVATIDDMMEQNRANNPGPVGGVEFEVNKILAENPIDTWDAPASEYKRVFGSGPEIFATSEEIAEVADLANFLDNVGSFYAPLNDEPSLASTLDDNNPPIAEEPEIKIADDSSSENLKGCASESCVGGELGDARSRPMSSEEQALQKQIKDAEAQRARLQEQLNKLPENTNVAALIKQAQEGLDAMHSDKKPTAAEARKIENGKAALDQLRQIAIGAGDTEMAKELADFRGRLASIDAKAASFAKLAAQSGGEAGAYLTSKGRELVNQLQSGVNAVKADGPSVLFETRKSDLPSQIKDTRDTIAELNSQIADNRQSFYALQAVNTARIPDTWASQSNSDFEPAVVVSDAYTSGSAAPTAYDWEPQYPSDSLFSTSGEITQVADQANFLDNAGTLVSPLSDEPSLGRVLDENNPPGVVTQPSGGINYAGDPEQTTAGGLTPVSVTRPISAEVPVVADVPKDIPLSDGPAIPVEGGNERPSVLSDAQVDEKVRTAFDAKLKDAQATVRYAQDLLARSESPTARLAAQTGIDEAERRLKAVEEASAAYKAGNPSPELQKVIERIRTGDEAGLFTQGLSALSAKAHSDAKAIGENMQTSVDITKPSALWEIPKMVWDGGAWGVASGIGMVADSGRNLLEKLDVVGFRADTDRELSAAIDPIGSEWKTVADVAVIAPFGTGLAKSAIGAGVDTAIDVGAAATRSAFGKVVESEAGLLVRDSAGFATTLERDAVARAAGDAVAAGETRLPGVTIRQGADDLPVPRNVANENIPLDAEVVQAARPARGATTAEADGVAVEASEQAPRGVTTRVQNPGDDLARVANDNSAAAPRAVEPPAGEITPAPRTPADVVPEVPTTPVVEESWFRRAYNSVFGKSETKPTSVAEDIVPFGEVPEGVRPVVRDFELPRTSEVTPPPAPRVEPTPEIPPTLVDVVDSGLPGPAPRFDVNPAIETPTPVGPTGPRVPVAENPTLGGPPSAGFKSPWETEAGGLPTWAKRTAWTAGGLGVATLGAASRDLWTMGGSGEVPPSVTPGGGGSPPPTGATNPPPTGAAVPGKDAPGVTPPAGDGGSVSAVVPPPADGGGNPPPTGAAVPKKDETAVPPPVKTDEPVVPPPGKVTKPPVVEPKPGPVTPQPDNSNVPSPTDPQNTQPKGGGGGGIGGMLSGLMGALSNLFGGSQSPQTTPTTPSTLTTPTPTRPTATSTATSTKPLVTLVANPAIISSTRTSRLMWSSIGADQCALFSNSIRMGVVSTKGATTTPPLSSTTSFTIRCATAAGIVGSATTTVNVPSGSGSGAVSTAPTASTEDVSAPSDTTDTSSNSNTDSDGGCDPTWNLVSYANCLLGK